MAVRGEGVAPFWLKPGEAAVTLAKGEEQKVDKDTEAVEEVFGSAEMRHARQRVTSNALFASFIFSISMWGLSPSSKKADDWVENG